MQISVKFIIFARDRNSATGSVIFPLLHPATITNRMILKKLLILLLIATSAAAAMAETPRKVVSKHLAMHQQQLANVNTRMDAGTVADMLKADIQNRELTTEAKGKLRNPLSPESQTMIKDLLGEAHRHLGKPYSRGSKGPSAFDCSGFSSYVFRQFGIQLGASSRDQYNQGEAIEKNELREGDLVFFTGSRRGGTIGHVGIVVSANNETGDFRFIHASNTYGISVTSSSGYFSGRYVGARRIITE